MPLIFTKLWVLPDYSFLVEESSVLVQNLTAYEITYVIYDLVYAVFLHVPCDRPRGVNIFRVSMLDQHI